MKLTLHFWRGLQGCFWYNVYAHANRLLTFVNAFAPLLFIKKLVEKHIPPPGSPDDEDLTLPPGSAPDRAAPRRTRRSFIGLGLAGLGGVLGWRYLLNRPLIEGVPAPFRKVLSANGRLTQAHLREARLAPEFAKSQGVAKVRTNGNAGLESDLDLAAWRLVVKPYGGGKAQEFTLADIQALPRVEMTTELKCIEGWRVVVNWAGARFADFPAKYLLASRSDQSVKDIARPPTWRPTWASTCPALSTPSAALLRNKRPAAAPCHAPQVRHQAPQANWHHRLHRHQARRLLGRAGLRLVREPLRSIISYQSKYNTLRIGD